MRADHGAQDREGHQGVEVLVPAGRRGQGAEQQEGHEQQHELPTTAFDGGAHVPRARHAVEEEQQQQQVAGLRRDVRDDVVELAGQVHGAGEAFVDPVGRVGRRVAEVVEDRLFWRGERQEPRGEQREGHAGEEPQGRRQSRPGRPVEPVRQQERSGEGRHREPHADGEAEQDAHQQRRTGAARVDQHGGQHEHHGQVVVPGQPARVGEQRVEEQQQDARAGQPVPHEGAPHVDRLLERPVHQEQGRPGREHGHGARGQEELLREVVQQAVHEHQVRHVEVREVAVGQQPLAGPERGAGDELVLVVIEDALHGAAEDQHQRACEHPQRQQSGDEEAAARLFGRHRGPGKSSTPTSPRRPRPSCPASGGVSTARASPVGAVGPSAGRSAQPGPHRAAPGPAPGGRPKRGGARPRVHGGGLLGHEREGSWGQPQPSIEGQRLVSLSGPRDRRSRTGSG